MVFFFLISDFSYIIQGFVIQVINFNICSFTKFVQVRDIGMKVFTKNQK